MNCIYAHEHPEDTSIQSVFLAGPSPRGNKDYDWRPEALRVLEEKGFKGNVYIPLPRKPEWTADFNYDAQIDWELKYLEASTLIIFWIPRDIEHLPGFTTNVEFGMFVKTGKVVLGYPTDAPKMRYLHRVAEKNNVPVSNSLEETIDLALKTL